MPEYVGGYRRIFLDTNVYIVGAADLNNPEGRILTFLGFEAENLNAPEVVISTELVEQILRVGKRLRDKDWASSLIARIWQNFNLVYVLIDIQEALTLEANKLIPREDIGIYLTAKQGEAECFISSNHELIRSIVEKTEDFACLTPVEFAQMYLT